MTILHRRARPLEAFDPDLVAMLVKRTRDLGIRVELDTEVRGIEAVAAHLVVRGARRGGGVGFETDMAVHSAGRVPELDDLHLETAGVKREKRGVVVNQFLQSVSNPAIYAGGDAAASGPPLTPKADHDAGVLTTNLLGGNRRTTNYDGIASAVFSLPPLASAGLTEAAARKGRVSRSARAGRIRPGGSTHAASGRRPPAPRCSSSRGPTASSGRICWDPTPMR